MENVARVPRTSVRVLLREGAPRRRSPRAATGAGARRRLAFVDADGEQWRTFHFIEGASSRDAVGSALEAGAAAEAFGRFLAQLVDLPGPRLHETIPHFHDARARFEQLVAAAKADEHGRLAGCRRDFEFVLGAGESWSRAAQALRGGLPERVTHNDTKINNVLLDDATGEGVCVIDLDTVMPGLALYDFGDLRRARATSPARRGRARSLAKVRVDPQLFAALVEGYLRGAGAALLAAERDELAFAGQLMTLLLGMRFLADHLAGDRYFRDPPRPARISISPARSSRCSGTSNGSAARSTRSSRRRLPLPASAKHYADQRSRKRRAPGFRPRPVPTVPGAGLVAAAAAATATVATAAAAVATAATAAAATAAAAATVATTTAATATTAVLRLVDPEAAAPKSRPSSASMAASAFALQPSPRRRILAADRFPGP